MLHVRDDLVGRQVCSDVRSEQFEVRAFSKADLKLDAAVNRRIVEHEKARFGALLQRNLDAAKLYVISNWKPDFLQALALTDDERQRLGELLPHGLQCVEVGVAPLFLRAGGEECSHAAASV